MTTQDIPCRRTTLPRSLFDPRIVQPALVDSFVQARCRASVAQPGDVRRLRRQHPHDGAVRAGARRPGRSAGRLHPRASRSGCGSRCCSPTSPRRWPRAAARRRPTSLRGAQARRHGEEARREPRRGAHSAIVPATTLRKGDVVLVEAGDIIPADGEVIEGVASVDESAITGESAPVIREAGGDRGASPAARACCPTGSSCASPPTRARRSSTA